MRLLSLTLRSYKWSRRILCDGLVGKPQYARRGIIAGSASATTELKLYLIQKVDDFARSYTGMALEMFIDDMTVDAEHHDEETFIRNLCAGGRQIVEKALLFKHIEGCITVR